MRSPVPAADRPRVHPGPALLAHLADGPSLAAHRDRYGDAPALTPQELLDLVDGVALRGRGGAAFPLAVKLRAALESGRRREVVVNASEGEPASAKDAALGLARPHLVLDGARAAATALGSRRVHVILPSERPTVAAAWKRAMAERPDRFLVSETSGGFVGGQAAAVLELMAGRPNLPVTAWEPAAVRGHRGRPTLLSNAETWAQLGLLALRGVAEFRRRGTDEEPGTTLVTWNGTDVHEVEFGRRLDVADRPVIVGGFHGTWVSGGRLASRPLSVAGFRAAGHPLGAGVLLMPDACPVEVTADVVGYLAGQSAGRCGPCLNGLPALATALRAVVEGRGGAESVAELCDLVTGRGACAHPDGTARLAGSLLTAYPDLVAAHGQGCSIARPAGLVAVR